jgi:fucose permease
MSEPAAAPAHAVRSLAVLCFVFVSAGYVMAAIGPVQPELAERAGTTLAAMARLSLAIFSGSLLAQFVAGRASDRLGRRLVLVVGAVLLALSGSAIALAGSLRMVLATGVVYGFGYGAFTLSGNVMSSELAPRRSASAVNLVNTFFGVGAVVGPLVVSLFLKRGGAAIPALWIGVALLAISAVASRALLPDVRPAPHHHDPVTTGRRATLRDPVLLACGVLLMLYVGSEVSAGWWAAKYLQQSTGMAEARSAEWVSLFWAMLTLGRVSAVVAGMRVSSEHLLTASVCTACAGSALMWAGHGSAAMSVTALAIMGFGYGPIYPTGVTVLTKRFPHAAGTATSRMGILAAAGGAVLPWLQGLVLVHWTTIDSARLTLLVAIAMVGAWEATRRFSRG